MRNLARGISRATAIISIIVIIILGIGVVYALSSTVSHVTTSSSITVTSPSVETTVSTSDTYSNASSSSLSSQRQIAVDETNTPDSLDPAVTVSNEGEEVVLNADPVLLYYNDSYNSFFPVLASSWTSSANLLTYTMQLRSGDYYNNGDPFNAYVVWWNLYRDMIMNQPAATPFFVFFNTNGVTAGDLNALDNPQNSPMTNETLQSIAQNQSNSISVINSTTVQFHLSSVFLGFLSQMGDGPPWSFTDPYTVEQHGGVVAGQPNTWMSVNGSTVGNGPMITQTYIPNDYSLLIANPHYWAQNISGNYLLQPSRIQRVIIYYKPDELDRALDLQSGKVQAAVISFSDVQALLAASNKTLYVPNLGPSGNIEFLQLDTERAPTNNILVREAIIDAINLTEIQQTAYYGYAEPFVGPEPSGFFGYNTSITPPSYNVTESRLLLKEAGFPNGQGLPTINFVYPSSDYLSDLAQILEEDLGQVGITLQSQELSMDAWLSVIYTCCGTNSTFPIISYNNWIYWPDFTGYEFLVDSAEGYEFTFNNQTVNNLVNMSNGELNSTLRAQEISQVQFDVQQQAAFVWLAQDLNIFPPGLGRGPIVWNRCIVGDPAYWQNVAWWPLFGVYFSALQSTC